LAHEGGRQAEIIVAPDEENGHEKHKKAQKEKGRRAS
jgi:hypothetical protein